MLPPLHSQIFRKGHNGSFTCIVANRLHEWMGSPKPCSRSDINNFPIFFFNHHFPPSLPHDNCSGHIDFMTFSHASNGISSTGSPHVAPLLLTKISIDPKWAFVSETTFFTSARFVTSHSNARASTPNSFNSRLMSSHAASLREQMTIFAPASASPFAICAPSPRAPPVTIAVFCSNLNKSSACIHDQSLLLFVLS